MSSPNDDDLFLSAFHYMYVWLYIKGNAVPVVSCEGPKGYGMSRLSCFLDNLFTESSKVVSLSSPPGRFMVHNPLKG
jgi:hypothetical protein